MHLRIDKTNGWNKLKSKLRWRKGFEGIEALSEATLRKRLQACRDWRTFCKRNLYSCDATETRLVSHLEEYMEPNINKINVHRDICCHLRRLYECANYSDDENPVLLYLEKKKVVKETEDNSCCSSDNGAIARKECNDGIIQEIFGSSDVDEHVASPDRSSNKGSESNDVIELFNEYGNTNKNLADRQDNSEYHVNDENIEHNEQENTNLIPRNIEDQDSDKLEALISLGKIDILKSFLKMPKGTRPDKADLKKYAEQIFK